MGLRPKTARVVQEGKEIEIPVDEVEVVIFCSSSLARKSRSMVKSPAA
jgi:hypothetical protein